MIKGKKRNGFLDLLKLIFACIIVVGHGDTIYGTAFPNKLIPIASFCVDFFFIVSGAMLLRSFEKQDKSESIGKDTASFIKHKIKGLLPNYYVAWIILFVLLNIGLQFKQVLLGFVKSIPELLFLDMSGIPNSPYNGNTWYISAMLISILLVYPLIRKNKDLFVHYFAPLIAIFGMGYILYTYQSTLVVKQWNGFLYFGLIRGVSEICLGCIVYELSKKLKTIDWTKFGKILLTIIEISLYVGVVLSLFIYSLRYYTFALLIALMIAICITLSDISYSKVLFSHKMFNWMGQYSYSLYLGHSIAYAGVFRTLIFKSNMTYSKTLITFFGAALMAGLVVMYLSKLCSYIWSKCGLRIRGLLINNS